MMKKSQNYFRSKKILIFLSFILVCCFSIFGFFSYKKIKVKAAIGTITDYEWANWFDYSFNDSALGRDIVVVGLNDYEAEFSSVPRVQLTFEDEGTYSFKVYLNYNYKASLSVLHAITTSNVSHYYSFNCSVNNIASEYCIVNSCSFFVADSNNGDIYYSVDLLSSDFTDFYDVAPNTYIDVGFDINVTVDLLDEEYLGAYAYLRLEDFVFNRGSIVYTYSPYFFDLESFPSPLPTPFNPDDSSSDDSSSDDSSSDDSSSDDSSSDNGYEEGYEEGFNTGYDSGYSDGLNYGKYGLFVNCTCYIQLNYNDLEYERIVATDDFFIYGGLDLSKFKPLVENKSGVQSWFIYFYFDSDALPVAPDFQFTGTGYYDVFYENPWSITFKNVPNSSQLRWNLVNEDTESDYNNVYRSEIPSSSFQNRYVISSFETPLFNSFSYLNGLTISIAKPLYELGFQQGLNAADNEAYGKGYEAGYNQGDKDGYNRGFNKGSSEDPYGLADFMFSYLDMPGRILSNWLNFEFMDVNLMGLLALVISVGLVAIVLKKVL